MLVIRSFLCFLFLRYFIDAMSDRIFILGIPIDSLTRTEALDRLRIMLQSSGRHHVMTPNNEMLVEAAKNPPFRTILQASALNLPDSTGLLLAARITGQRLKERVPGVDVVEELLRTLEPGHPVFFLGGRSGVPARAAAAMQVKNPGLRVAGCYEGSPRPEEAHEIIRRIQGAKPHCSSSRTGRPRKDLWIDRHLKELPTVRVAIGVGGTFDVLSGEIRRAPALLRAVGLEWLWRLLQEPRRIGRMFRAVIAFPVFILCYGQTLPSVKARR